METKKSSEQSQEQPHSQIPNKVKSKFSGMSWLFFLLSLGSLIILPVYVSVPLVILVFVAVKGGWFEKWDFWKIIIILAILIIIYFLLMASGIAPAWMNFGAVSTAQAQADLENTGVWNSLKNSLGTTLKTIQDPNRVYTENPSVNAEVEQNTNNQQLGLKVENFGPISNLNSFKENEKVELRGRVLISSLEDDASVTLNCILPESDSDAEEMNQKVIVYPQKVSLTKGQVKTISVLCTYPNGFKLDPDSSKKVVSKKIYLTASYDFKTLASLDSYVLPDQVFQAYIQEALKKTNGNPYPLIFDKEQNSKLNKQTGKVTSTFTYGPMKLAIDIEENQPLLEIGPYGDDSYYTLVIQLTKSSSLFTGRLKQLKSLTIEIPENLELEPNAPLDPGETTEGFTSYTLTAEDLRTQNTKFINPKILDPILEKRLKLKVSQLNRETLEKTFILADVNYIYEDKYGTTIVIAKSEETVQNTGVLQSET